ncbi:MAG: single-stranded-DNA-specific exonuclease RecJ [Clostridiales bacterium]|nr:single-stranded-DNA-specific exonuclease RecJ [Clostridiales bacterium]
MIDINPIIVELLGKRGIFDEDEIAEFLSEKPQRTYDPFLLRNMEAGVDLILSSASRGKRICIYGDYDADGITSVSLLTHVLSHLTKNLEYYVPDRFDEGYGLNMAAVESIKKRGADLVITVDCGSTSCAEAERAKDLGLEMVITDHHSIAGRAAGGIVINPKLPGCPYPFKQLAGVGVAFKLAQAIQRKANLPRRVLTDVLDLVAVGTIGDVVPLVDENRTLAKYGLRELNRLNRKGMKSLTLAACLKAGGITSENVAFVIVPHLNSAGRMDKADFAVDLLITEDEDVIRENTVKLVESNKSRKKVQEETYQQCVEIVDGQMLGDKFLLMCPEGAHEGTAGIVAGKIKDKYNRPAIIVTTTGGISKGTGRSIEKVNLYELLRNFENLFIKFGGHAAACGFSMESGNLQALKFGLEDKMRELHEADPGIFDDESGFDLKIKGKDATFKLGEMIECLAPFGNRNRKPLLCIDSVRIENAAAMGEDGKHLRFTGRSPDGGVLQCVLFHKAQEYKDAVISGKPASIIGTLEPQVWNGSKRVQFLVEKIVLEGDADYDD